MSKKDKIPEITSIWNGKSKKELRELVLSYYRKNIAGTTIVNKDLDITISFSVRSGRKTAYGEAMYLDKAEAVRILPQIMENAVYNNWGCRKPQDPKEVIGYLYFKGKYKLDGTIKHVRIAVKFLKSAKFYYSLEVNMIK